MGTEFITEFRKVGNSIAVIVPKNVTDVFGIREGDMGRIDVQKINRDEATTMQLREKYAYEGANGKLIFGSEEVGTVKRIFFNTHKVRTREFTKPNAEWEETTIADGVLFANMSFKDLGRMFGPRFLSMSYMLPMSIEIQVEDKKGVKYDAKIEEISHACSNGLNIVNKQFTSDLTKFELTKPDKANKKS